jgi:hypothetical protein
MIESMKKALEYAISKSEDPGKIKEYVEEYFALAGYDRRFKFKWRAICGNHKYTYSGIFEYYGREYYFSKIGCEIKVLRR